MQIQQVMNTDVQFVPANTTLAQAATKMKEVDVGFLPIADSSNDSLQGVITDRDIVIRAIAEGKDPKSTTVAQAKTDRTLYCFETDDVDDAVASMKQQQVYRLLVLNNQQEKRLCGIVSLGDIARQNEETLGGEAVRDITSMN